MRPRTWFGRTKLKVVKQKRRMAMDKVYQPKLAMEMIKVKVLNPHDVSTAGTPRQQGSQRAAVAQAIADSLGVEKLVAVVYYLHDARPLASYTSTWAKQSRHPGKLRAWT